MRPLLCLQPVFSSLDEVVRRLGREIEHNESCGKQDVRVEFLPLAIVKDFFE